jgi:hypothetical protein
MAPAFAEAPARVRGTIIALDDGSLTVKERDDRTFTLKTGPDTAYAYVVPSNIDAIKVNDFVGSAVKGSLRAMVAVELAIIPEDMPWAVANRGNDLVGGRGPFNKADGLRIGSQRVRIPGSARKDESVVFVAAHIIEKPIDFDPAALSDVGNRHDVRFTDTGNWMPRYAG